MGRDITVTLDDIQNAPTTEQADVEGWVQQGWADPNWVPTKLVLSLRTRERWAQVAKFFPELAPQQPPIEPPVEPPVTPPAGPTLLLDIPFTMMSDYLRTNGFSGETTLALRFTVPASYNSTEGCRISGAEFGGGPITRDSCISTVAFDFDHALPNGSDRGNPVVQFWMQVGGSHASRVILQAGQTYYCNVRNPTAPAGSACEMSFQMMVPPGG